MKIADAQVHIWGADTPARPWPPAQLQPHKPMPFTRDDLLREMDTAGVHRAVIVPPMWEGDRNDLGLEAARLYPDRFAVMGRFNPQAPDARNVLARLRDERGMFGLRFTFHRPSLRPLLAEGRVEWLWDDAEKLGFAITLHAQPEDMRIVGDVADRHPQLKLMIDHAGLTTGKDDEAFSHLDTVLALSRHANIAVKVSSLSHYTTDRYPYRFLHSYLRRIYDRFGAKRMFWGSDLTRLPCTYREAVTMFTDEIPWLTASDKDWIMGRALCEWIGWRLT